MNRHATQLIALGAALALQACQDRPEPTEPARRGVLSASVTTADPAGRHLVVFTAERVPADFGDRVSRLGGSVESALDNIGVAAVEPDVATAPPNEDLGTDGATADEAVSEPVAPADATGSPTTARFYARQWNLRAVFAPEAWAAGHLGSRDVKVAIVDTGIDYLLPDLAGLVDLAHSTSFVPEDVIPTRYAGRLPFSGKLLLVSRNIRRGERQPRIGCADPRFRGLDRLCSSRLFGMETIRVRARLHGSLFELRRLGVCRGLLGERCL